MTDNLIRLLAASLAQHGLANDSAMSGLSFRSGSDQFNDTDDESLCKSTSSSKRIAFDGSLHVLSDQELTSHERAIDPVRVLRILLDQAMKQQQLSTCGANATNTMNVPLHVLAQLIEPRRLSRTTDAVDAFLQDPCVFSAKQSLNRHQRIKGRMMEHMLPWLPTCIPWSDIYLASKAHSQYEHVKTIIGHRQPAFCILFDKADRRLITGGDDGLVKIWCMRTGFLLFTLKGHSNCISDIGIDNGNRVLACGSLDGYITFWDLQMGILLFQINAYSPILTLEFRPCHQESRQTILMATCSDGYAKFWAVDLQQRTASESPIKFHCKSLARDEIRCGSFSPGGMRFVTGATDGIVRLMKVPELEEIQSSVASQPPHHTLPYVQFLDDHEGYVNSVHFASTGDRFVTSSWDGSVRLWFYRGCPVNNLMTVSGWQSQPFYLSDSLTNRSGDAAISHNSAQQFASPSKVTIVSFCCRDRVFVAAVSSGSFELCFQLTDVLADGHFKKNGSTNSNFVVKRFHRNDVYVLNTHPLDDRLVLSAGCDGRAALWLVDVASDGSGEISVKCVFEYYTEHARYLDGSFCQDGHMFALVDDLGRVSMFATGIGSLVYHQTPSSQFFPTDWNDLVFDGNHNAVDAITMRPPDKANRDVLMTIERQVISDAPNASFAFDIPTACESSAGVLNQQLFQRQRHLETMQFEVELKCTVPDSLPRVARSRRRRPIYGSDVEELESVQQAMMDASLSATSGNVITPRRMAAEDDEDEVIYSRSRLRSETDAELSILPSPIRTTERRQNDRRSGLGRRRWSLMGDNEQNGVLAGLSLPSNVAAGGGATRRSARLAADVARQTVEQRVGSTSRRRTSAMAFLDADWEQDDDEDDEPFRPLSRAERLARRESRRSFQISHSYSTASEEDEDDEDDDDGDDDEGTAEILHKWQRVQWLCGTATHRFPFVPQLGDLVVYLADGHRQFLETVSLEEHPNYQSNTTVRSSTRSRRGSNLPSSGYLPWEQNNGRVLSPVTAGRIMLLEYLVGGWCCATISIMSLSQAAAAATREDDWQRTMDEYQQRSDSGRIQVTWRDEEGVSDFIIPFALYSWSVSDAQIYSQGDVVGVCLANGLPGELEEAVVQSVAVPPHRIAERPWQCYRLQWLEDHGQSQQTNEEDEESSSFFSPWELEPIIMDDDGIVRSAYEATLAGSIPVQIRSDLVQSVSAVIRDHRFSAFVHPVPMHDFEDYVDVVAHPVDLNMLRDRLKRGFYRRLAAFEHDVQLIRSNAASYNESSSTIVKDSAALVDRLLLASRNVRAQRTTAPVRASFTIDSREQRRLRRTRRGTVEEEMEDDVEEEDLSAQRSRRRLGLRSDLVRSWGNSVSNLSSASARLHGHSRASSDEDQDHFSTDASRRRSSRLRNARS